MSWDTLRWRAHAHHAESEPEEDGQTYSVGKDTWYDCACICLCSILQLRSCSDIMNRKKIYGLTDRQVQTHT